MAGVPSIKEEPEGFIITFILFLDVTLISMASYHGEQNLKDMNGHSMDEDTFTGTIDTYQIKRNTPDNAYSINWVPLYMVSFVQPHLR